MALIRTLGLIGNVRLDYTTSPGTASLNEDFLQLTGSVIFVSGQSSQTIVVKILEVLFILIILVKWWYFV